jgi:hypothetical protein
VVILGWVALGVGAALLVWSLWATLRANSDRTVPYNRDTEVVPRGSILSRAIGAGMFVLSAVLLSTQHGPWIVVLPLAVAVAGFLAIAHHNRRVGRADIERGHSA